MNIKNRLLILLFVFIIGCGYQPIHSGKEIKYSIKEIKTLGDKDINRYILQSINVDKNNFKQKIYFLEIDSNYVNIISSKDTKGNPKTFRIEIICKVKIFENNKLVNSKIFKSDHNYNNLSSKFELKKYEEKIKMNLTNKISENISIYLQSL